MSSRDTVKKGVPLILPLQEETTTSVEKPSNDLRKSVRLYIKVK